MHTSTLILLHQSTPTYLATFFNLDDPDERFMLGWISRVHTESPRLYQALAMKRSDHQTNNKVERLLYEFARFRGKRGGFTVITWNIDAISMRWRDFVRRSEAWAHYQSL